MTIDPDLIRQMDDPLHWAMFVHQLDEAREHLAELTEEMLTRGEIDEIDLCIQLGHIYGHINRAWNCRKLKGADVSDWYTDSSSSFPTDVTISGVEL